MASKRKKTKRRSHAFIYVAKDFFRCERCGVEMKVDVKRTRHYLFFRSVEKVVACGDELAMRSAWQTEPIPCA